MNVDMRLKDDVRGAKQRNAKKEKKTKESQFKDDEEDENENGLHFIAYVPACGMVWKMDGMESRPESLGRLVKTAHTEIADTSQALCRTTRIGWQ